MNRDEIFIAILVIAILLVMFCILVRIMKRIEQLENLYLRSISSNRNNLRILKPGAK